MTNDLILRHTEQHGLAMQMMLDDKLYERTTSIAARMAKAEGFIPKHLVGKPEACYAVVTRSITWGLDPFAVALATYQTPGGSIGFEGKLCHGILERSGRFDGRIKYEMIGDWTKIQGKFIKKTSQKGNEYFASNWKEADEAGLGVKIIAKLIGEKEPIIFDFWLIQAQPRNSTLWALDPVTQIKYTAIRRFANSIVPDIFMGLPFDQEFDPYAMQDVTPESKAKGKKERKESEDITSILHAQSETIKDDGIADNADIMNENGFAGIKEGEKLPAETLKPLPGTIAENKANDIIALIEATKDENGMREVVQANESHILFMPPDLSSTIYAAIDSHKEKLGIPVEPDHLFKK